MEKKENLIQEISKKITEFARSREFKHTVTTFGVVTLVRKNPDFSRDLAKYLVNEHPEFAKRWGQIKITDDLKKRFNEFEELVQLTQPLVLEYINSPLVREYLNSPLETIVEDETGELQRTIAFEKDFYVSQGIDGSSPFLKGDELARHYQIKETIKAQLKELKNLSFIKDKALNDLELSIENKQEIKKRKMSLRKVIHNSSCTGKCIQKLVENHLSIEQRELFGLIDNNLHTFFQPETRDGGLSVSLERQELILQCYNRMCGLRNFKDLDKINLSKNLQTKLQQLTEKNVMIVSSLLSLDSQWVLMTLKLNRLVAENTGVEHFFC